MVLVLTNNDCDFVVEVILYRTMKWTNMSDLTKFQKVRCIESMFHRVKVELLHVGNKKTKNGIFILFGSRPKYWYQEHIG